MKTFIQSATSIALLIPALKQTIITSKKQDSRSNDKLVYILFIATIVFMKIWEVI